MPYQPVNFLQAEAKPYGPHGLLESAIEGYKASRLPKQITQEERQRDLKAQLTERQGEELQQKIKNPAMYSNVPEAVLFGLSQFEQGKEGQQGEPTEQSEKYRNLAEKLIKKRHLDLQRKEQIINSNEWNLMNVDQKSNVAAVANALGLEQEKLAKGVSEGKSLREIAKENRFSDDEIQEAIENPKHLATRATQTAAQTRGTFAEEREVMSGFINKALEKFPRTLFGFSPEMVALQLRDMNEDDQSDYWAARALGPENAGITAKMLGLPGGIQLLRSIQDKALTETKAFKSLISPKVYAETQRKINETTQNAFSAGQKFALSPGGKKKEKKQPSIEQVINSGETNEEDINGKRASALTKGILDQANKQRHKEITEGKPSLSAALNVKPEIYSDEIVNETAARKGWTEQKRLAVLEAARQKRAQLNG